MVSGLLPLRVLLGPMGEDMLMELGVWGEVLEAEEVNAAKPLDIVGFLVRDVGTREMTRFDI
jgi:hypothetical protein